MLMTRQLRSITLLLKQLQGQARLAYSTTLAHGPAQSPLRARACPPAAGEEALRCLGMQRRDRDGWLSADVASAMSAGDLTFVARWVIGSWVT